MIGSHRVKSRGERERGVAAVWVALTMTVLIGFVGMGIDVGFWHYQGWKQQQAADQAALAGAVFLPEKPLLAAAAARESAKQNGFDSSVLTTTGTGGSANRLKVTLDRTHRSFFSQVVGKFRQNIVRSSTAEFVPPLTIGSPFARAGNDPEDAAGGNFNYWLSQHGPWARKHDGDRYASDICDAASGVAHPTPYGCAVSTQTRGMNADYERIGKYGYRYAVDVSSITPGKDLVFEVFDGVTSNVGNLCNWGNLPSPTQRNALSAYVGDADTRYRSGSEAGGLQWCSADEATRDASRANQYMDTEFSVYSQTRTVTTGGLVSNTTPPTTAPPIATTTTLPGGGATIAGPCSPATSTGATTLNVNNDRAASVKVYWVNTACLETLVATTTPGTTWTASTFEGYRYRFYDAVTGGLINEYTVPAPPSTVSYARRSLENSSGLPGNFLSTSGSLVAQSALTTTGAQQAASFEVTPALNGTVGCVSFKSAQSTPVYLSYASASGPVSFATNVSSAPSQTNATWCPTASATGMPTVRFTSSANASSYLWANGTSIATSTAPSSWSAAEWYVTMPAAPRANEPFPVSVWVTILNNGNRTCLDANGTALNSQLRINTCNANTTQQFQLQVDGSRYRLSSRGTSYIVRPNAGATAVGTYLRLESPAGTTQDSYLTTVSPGGVVTLSPDAGSVYISNYGATGSSVSARLRSTSPASYASTIRVGQAGQIFPISYSGSSGTQTISFVEHLNNTGTCPTSGTASDLTVTNPRTGPVGVYLLGASCRETFLGEVAAGGSKTFTGLYTGARLRIHDVSMNRLAAAVAISSVNQTYVVPTTGPGTPCSALSGAAATINFTNQRTAPVRVFAIDSSCNVIHVTTLATNGVWSASTYAGAVWQTVDTLTGGVRRTVTAVAGVQAVTEVEDTLTAGNCSTTTGIAQTLEVVNQRTTSLELRRIDDACVETVFAVIAPSSTTTYASHDGERWKIYEGAALVADQTMANPTETVTIEASSTWTYDPNAGYVTGTALICTRVETTYPMTSYNPADPHTGTVVQLVNPFDGAHDNGAGTRDPFAESFTLGFRRWKQFCKVPAAQVQTGRYTITVKTNLNNESAGNNSYSLRAAWQGATPTDRSEAGLQLSAIENFPVFINLGGSSTSTLYMTRLHPIHASRQLRLELFDIGDVSGSGSVNLKILPPPDSNVGASWGCSMKLVAQNGTFNPVGVNTSDCSIVGLKRVDYNGAAVQIDIPIPTGFTCDISVPTNCWARVQITFNGGTQPTDRTTWSAVVLGDPLRIVR